MGGMSGFIRVRLPAIILVASATLMFAAPAALAAADGALVHAQETPSSIVIGFVGGFVRHDNPHHGPVIFATHLQQTAPQGAYVQVFENRHRNSAYKTIVRLLDRNHDGVLSDDEKAQARIVLYGQSWGAATALLLARQLNRAGIPVLLTVQVDSVSKLWQNDSVIPSNVIAAANFYQPHGLVRGQSKIRAADPEKTQIIGNFRFDYKQTPVKCPAGYSWLDHHMTHSHMQIECDPRVWAQVEDLVLPRIEPQSNSVAAVPQP
jgi:hypothetical protein